MAQWMKGLAVKHEDLSSIPGTHMVEGRELTPIIALWPPPVCKINKALKTNFKRILASSLCCLPPGANCFPHVTSTCRSQKPAFQNYLGKSAGSLKIAMPAWHLGAQSYSLHLEGIGKFQTSQGCLARACLKTKQTNKKP